MKQRRNWSLKTSKQLSLLCLFCVWLQGVACADSLLITWQDNSDNENGFVIERTLVADCSTTWEVIGYTPADYNRLIDNRVPGACYRVAAFNDDGISPYSDIAQLPNDSWKPKKAKKPKKPKKRKERRHALEQFQR
jgi:hypothetical protein